MSVIVYAKCQLILPMCPDLQLFFVRQQKTQEVEKELKKKPLKNNHWIDL